MANAFQANAFQRGAFQHYQQFDQVVAGGGLRPFIERDGHAEGAVIVVKVYLVPGRATASSHTRRQSIAVDLRCMGGTVAGDAIAGGSLPEFGVSLDAGLAKGELYLSEDELLILAIAA